MKLRMLRFSEQITQPSGGIDLSGKGGFIFIKNSINANELRVTPAKLQITSSPSPSCGAIQQSRSLGSVATPTGGKHSYATASRR